MNPANSSQALTNLQQYQSGMQSPDQSLQNADQSLGVNAAQQQVTGLRGAIANTTNLLNQVAPSVYGRTQNSLVTNAQATQQIGNEQAPINDQLNKENTDYSNANSDYQNLEQKAEAQANAEQAGQNNQLSALQNIYQDLFGQESNASDMAEKQREFNAQEADSAASRAAAAAKDATPSLASAIAQSFIGYQPASSGGKAYATERAILPALYSEYGTDPATEAAIKQQVYAFRKANFGE